MLETVTLQSGDKMDYSTPFRMAEDGSLSHNNQTVHGTYSKTFKNKGVRPPHQILEDPFETTGELVSAVLDGTTTIDLQFVQKRTEFSAIPFTSNEPPKQPAQCNTGTVEPSQGSALGGAILNANMRALEANRAQALAAPGSTLRIRSSTTLQPKTTSRQRKGTVRQRKAPLGSNGIEPQHDDCGTGKEVLSGWDLSPTTFPPPVMPRQAVKKLDKIKEIHPSASDNQVPNHLLSRNRQSASVLALSDATKLGSEDVMALRRSKTTRYSKKDVVTKQQSVLKKMTVALTDRLHLTAPKGTKAEPHAADGDRGSGYHDYGTNQFVQDVVSDIPTQKRQLPSRLTEIYERNECSKESEHISDELHGQSTKKQRPRSSTGMDLYDDPFADADCTRRFTTDFVHRLKATTPPKDGRDLAPVTPSVSSSDMEALLRGSINSLLPFPPLGASTPRITVTRRRSSGFEEANRPLMFAKRKSISGVSPGAHWEVANVGLDQAWEEHVDDTMRDAGHNAAPPHPFTYRPILNMPNRKKHPSPNKVELELLESRLRRKWPETLSQATENAKKHPSPLKIDMQALGDQFRTAYPDLLGGNTPDRRKKATDLRSAANCEDERDELALSLVLPTPEKKRATRPRKVSSVICFGQTAALGTQHRRSTIVMNQCGSLLNPGRHAPLVCPDYHHA